MPGKLKGVRSQFSLRSISEEANLRNRIKVKEANARLLKSNSSDADKTSSSNIRHGDLRLLETVKELESEKSRSVSNDSFCSTPS